MRNMPMQAHLHKKKDYKAPEKAWLQSSKSRADDSTFGCNERQ
jgi:hypothetical protein